MKVQSKKVAYFSENINEELFTISKELLPFSFNRYKHVILPNSEQFFDQFPISEEEREYYYPYYYWWTVFCARGIIPKNKTIYQMFLQENHWKFKKKPHLESTLLKWQYVFPSFYYIDEMASQGVFRLFDIFDSRKYKVAITPHHPIKQPTSKDMLAGIVLPLPDGGYFSVADLLIIPGKIKSPLLSKVVSFYLSENTTTTNEFFSKNHPEILKITIEHLLESQIKVR